MLYALGESYETAPAAGYSEELPAGTDAGIYYVWYYAKGDEMHADSDPACMADPAVIEKKDATVTASDQVVEQGEEADLSAGSAVLEGAAEGQTLDDVALTSGNSDHAGKVSIIPGAAKIADADGNDVTKNYEISYQNGTLTVKGKVYCIRQNSDGTWPRSPQGAEAFTRPGTDDLYVVEEETAEQYADDHYSLKGYSPEYHMGGSCTGIHGSAGRKRPVPVL